MVAQMFRLVRITRVNSLTKSSIAIQDWYERQNVPRMMLGAFILRLIIASHCIACFWSFIAFMEARTFGSELGEEPNWISHWYATNYVEGGIMPIGWENDIDRYALSLFWAIQTITSIGYGNIVPVTRIEYYFSNILMLLSGIFWAFLIGNLVTIVEHMNAKKDHYKRTLDEINTLIRCFSPTGSKETPLDPCEQTMEELGVGDPKAVATRLRRFVGSQYELTSVNKPVDHNACTLDQLHPTLSSLSPELRRLTGLHLMMRYIEMVPFLSHKYLTPEEQAEVAFKCVFLEFSAGESFTKHRKLGRGIMFLRKGSCMTMAKVRTKGVHGPITLKMYNPGMALNINESLVEDISMQNDLPLYRFLTYSLVVFLPRTVICDVLHSNKVAWKSCARWKYLQACLMKWSKEKNLMHRSGTECSC
ncbi:hypothetical protein ACHAWF_013267 [Thalassiosira exigua]